MPEVRPLSPSRIETISGGAESEQKKAKAPLAEPLVSKSPVTMNFVADRPAAAAALKPAKAKALRLFQWALAALAGVTVLLLFMVYQWRVRTAERDAVSADLAGEKKRLDDARTEAAKTAQDLDDSRARAAALLGDMDRQKAEALQAQKKLLDEKARLEKLRADLEKQYKGDLDRAKGAANGVMSQFEKERLARESAEQQEKDLQNRLNKDDKDENSLSAQLKTEKALLDKAQAAEKDLQDQLKKSKDLAAADQREIQDLQNQLKRAREAEAQAIAKEREEAHRRR